MKSHRKFAPPNHALQRRVAGYRGCNRRASWPPSLSWVVIRHVRQVWASAVNRGKKGYDA